WASRSRLKPFVKLARTIRKHKAGVLAAIEIGISNGRLEALNSKVRLPSHRAYGFHSADALIAMIYLCCAGITIPLPHR
ncbi:MAG TPA: transposase, partial [Solirubrobacteraceae bacterium]|nr:transposase [Solirubrobacteraceae bacterium]